MECPTCGVPSFDGDRSPNRTPIVRNGEPFLLVFRDGGDTKSVLLSVERPVDYSDDQLSVYANYDFQGCVSVDLDKHSKNMEG